MAHDFSHAAGLCREGGGVVAFKAQGLGLSLKLRVCRATNRSVGSWRWPWAKVDLRVGLRVGLRSCQSGWLLPDEVCCVVLLQTQKGHFSCQVASGRPFVATTQRSGEAGIPGSRFKLHCDC